LEIGDRRRFLIDDTSRDRSPVEAVSLFGRLSFRRKNCMSAPSRRPEIRRRRTRKEKILQLRKRLAAAKTDGDRTRITAKLHKLAIASPGQPLLK
jgi:hypothetical protein